MAKRGSSKAGKNFKLFRRVYSPLNHLVSLTRNVGKNAFRTTGRLVNNGLGFVQRTGRGVVTHANGAITGVVRGTRRKNRRNARKSRKNRR